MFIYDIIISMSNYDMYSANSQNIKHFKLKQKVKNLIIIAIIGIPVLLGVAVYYYYREITNPNKTTNKSGSQTSLLGANSERQQVLTNNDNSQLPGQSTPSSVTNSSSSNSNQNSSNNTSNLPPTVAIIVDYTESKGAVNNPYIHSNLDISSFKDATKITFDKNSWTQYGQNQGSMDFSIQISGKTKQGTATFGLENDTWKIIGYGLKD